LESKEIRTILELIISVLFQSLVFWGKKRKEKKPLPDRKKSG